MSELWLALVAAGVVGSLLAYGFKREVVYPWEAALLYVDGRFIRQLAAGSHQLWRLGRKPVIHRVPAHDLFQNIGPIDTITADGFALRMAAATAYRIVDPRAVLENSNQHVQHLQMAASEALIAAAAARSLETLVADRASLGPWLLDQLKVGVAACEPTMAMVTQLQLPPETRRMMTEVERAKREGLAALERARGEHAALRSLANAARMLKDNPELVRLRTLQALSPTGRGATLVLGQDALAGRPNES